MEWEQLLELYVLESRAAKHSERTISNRVSLLRHLAEFTGKSPQEITRTDLMRVLTRGIAASSMQRERADYQSFFRFAFAEGHIPEDPSCRLPKQKVVKGEPRPFTLEQIEGMLSTGAYAGTRIKILLGYLQGLRAHEIAKIQGRDFDRQAGILRVDGKGGRVRYLPIHELLEAELDSWPAEGYWFPAQIRTGMPGGREHIHWKSVSDVLSRARARAGISGADRLTGHSLRHSFATHLVEADVPITSVQKLMGHASLQTTQIYVEVAAGAKRAAINALPGPVVPRTAGRKRESPPAGVAAA